MELVLHTVQKGARFTIYALEEQPAAGGTSQPKCPLLEFLAEAEQKWPDEWAKLAKRMERAADHGPPRNEEQCKQLAGDIYEFKTRGGLRVLWFYEAGRMIICTHGFRKNVQKTPRQEIRRAQEWKAKYDVAKRQRRIKIIEEN